MKRTIVAGVGVVLGGLVGFFGHEVTRWASSDWEEPSGLPALGPWRPELGLRGSFESLPAPGPGRRPRSRPRLRLLDDNPEAWVERWRLLADARRSIDVATFIVRDDPFGLAFIGHLLARARDGVRVRLLVDGHGTDMNRSVTDEDYLDELVAAGIETRVYRPMAARITQALVELDPVVAIASEHDKLLLIDGRHAVVGGRNIAEEYFADFAGAPRAFHDVDVAIDAPSVARTLGGAFEAEWGSPAAEPVEVEDIDVVSSADELLAAYRAMSAFLNGRSLEAGDAAADEALQALLAEHPDMRGALRRKRRPPAAEGEVRLLDSGPRRGEADDPLTEGLRRLLETARTDVLIETPYLVLSKAAVDVFARAAARGVRITIVTNSPTSSDNAVSQAFFLEQWPEVLARVPTLRLFVRGDGHNLHGKTAVFDGQVAVISTYNLDPVSMAVDGEVAVVVWSKTFAAQAAGPARSMIAEGAPTTYEYRIVRDARGLPVREEDGRPRVEYGPQDHTDPTRWKALTRWWNLLGALRKGGFEPLF